MSKFSVYLKTLLDNSNESIASVARSIGAERTSIHKALTDERILPVKVVHALADHFHLSIEERQHFFQLYDILFQGEDTWNNRQAICKLLNRLSNISFHNVTPPHLQNYTLPSPGENVQLFNGEYAVENAIRAVLVHEAINNPGTKFQMYLPDDLDPTKVLTELWMSGADFRVDQLFCFPAVSNDCTQKIRQLHQIIPLSLISRNAYSPYYFYERPGITNPLNYYIVTPHYLIQISPDHATAQIQCDSHLISHFSQYFQNLLVHCDLLVFSEANVFDALQRYNDTANPNGLQFMMPQPCFGRYFTPEMIEKNLQFIDESCQVLFELTAKRSAFLRSIRENYYTIFTEEGLRDFVETGVMIELPRKYIPPFCVEDRIFFLSQLRSEIAEGAIIGLIARPSYLKLPDYISIYIDSNMELHFDTTEAFIYGAYSCDIHIAEKSICQAFQSFFQSLPGSQFVYSQEETLGILDGSIAQLENMLRVSDHSEGACEISG